MKKYIATAFFTLLFFASCGKEDSLTKSELISKSPWILSASSYSPPYPTEYGLIVDGYAALPEYLKDDLYYYQSSGIYTHKEGATSYTPYDYDVWEVGIWAFSDDETMLYKGVATYLNEYEILTLNGSELQLRYYIYDTLDNIYTVTDTYIHP
ncbi:MAG: hypothetical protein JXB00_17080 [Bacteroidales bacterium]|nr:hypothetical protein [Bacteroidales bacterium]